MTDRVDFARAMTVLATALQQELDEAVIGVYWNRLKDVPHALLMAAFGKALERRWFRLPQPAELKLIAAEIASERRQLAAAAALADCPHSGHWLTNDRGDVTGRCGCWKAAQLAMEHAATAVVRPMLMSGGDE